MAKRRVSKIVDPIFLYSYNVAKHNRREKENKNLMEALNMGEEGYTKATSGKVVKFEKEGDAIEGKLISIEPSRQFQDSYALKLKSGGEIKVIFVSKIVLDLIAAEGIQKDQQIKLLYKGLKDNKAGTLKYHDYELFYK